MLSIIGIIGIVIVAIAIDLPVELVLTFSIIWIQNLLCANDWPFDFEYVGMIFVSIVSLRALVVTTIRKCRE